MPDEKPQSDVLFTARHSLFWLIIGNGVGLWLSILLLFPQLNVSELTFGRLVPVHLNIQLYGWSSLPLIACLFQLYPAKSAADVQNGRVAIIAWSLALALGCVWWMAGKSSGKIFLEWQGFPRVALPCAMLFLWSVLASRTAAQRNPWRLCGLVVLLPVPLIWYFASSPHVYPSVNPETSGPTGASLLGSTLVVVLLLLIAGPLLGVQKPGKKPVLAWIVMAAETLIFAFATKTNSSHRSLEQILILGSLLAWIPLFPAYFSRFSFCEQAIPWLRAALFWFSLLALSGWISFLPRVLDGMKFSSGLVAHSHLAMAGFVTAFNFALLATIIRAPSLKQHFWLWNVATLGFVVVMWVAGTLESVDAAFTIMPNSARMFLYSARAFCGVALSAASISWFASLRHV